ncbi:hypothetical protein Glove_350g38 [Diversispora epigaea]|uniref:Protein kinase domain-containing protein n=1 Tax=Diversispora epigaea TaxID=1348612 RepID=A0A397HCQ1_9GLOM|nr:hypothetical protein Glove_350g38 [Diversispora epigaea]
MCTKENFTKNWSSGNADIDKIIQESQINNLTSGLQWIPYENFYDIEHIADCEYYTLHLALLRNKIDKRVSNFVELKELKDYKYDISEFIKAIKKIVIRDSKRVTRFFGVSKNPSTKNYIIVMESIDDTIHSCLSRFFLRIEWGPKIDMLHHIIEGLDALHENNLVHCDLHSRTTLLEMWDLSTLYVKIDPGLCKLANDLILNSDNKSNNVYGSIPYIPPEVLRGNEFTKEGDIYSLGGIMYEIVTGSQPFADQAHDTYLMIDICNGVRPKVPDMTLNWIPKCYLDMMYQCWDDDPFKRPTTHKLTHYLYYTQGFSDFGCNMDIMERPHEKIFLRSLNNFHPQSCYISRNVYTLYGLKDSLEDIKSGKCADPNLYTYMNSEESSKCID